MRALITGVNGFVGGYLSQYLIENGMEVWGTKLPSEVKSKYLNEDVIVRGLDIRDKRECEEVIKECEPDYLIHLAAQSSVALSWKNPQLTMDININGTLNLLDAIRTYIKECRILLIGSSEEYGLIKEEEVPVNESKDIDPSNPYAISKATQELLAKQYIKAYGLDIVMVRAFNHIGPRQSDIFVVSDFAKRIVMMEKGLLEPVLKVGNLESKRDFTDVRDIVKGYELLLKHGKCGEVYNIGSGVALKISEILEKLMELSGKDISIEKDLNRMRPSDNPIIQCDNGKLKSDTKWDTTYNIDKTLRDVMDYWRKEVGDE